MKLKSIETEANLVNEPTANDLDAASRIGPMINKHLTSLEALCKLIPDCSNALGKIKDLRAAFAEKISLQPNVLETPVTMEQQVKQSSQQSVGNLEKKLTDMAKGPAKLDYNTIDSAMKEISRANRVTPDDLHKLFVASHGGMTPDDYAKAVRDKSINEQIAELYDTLHDTLGESVWVAISKELYRSGYDKTEVKESVNNAIIKLSL